MSSIRRIYDEYYRVYFITVKTYNNSKVFNDKRKIKLLRRIIIYLINKKYFKLHAWVILPDHFHLLLEITGKKNISEVMHDLKSYAAHQISDMIITQRRRGFQHSFKHRRRGFHASPEQSNGRRSVEASAPEGRKYVKIWQTSFYDHVIRNQNDFNNHANYIHYNPVKHGYVSKPQDWPWSSFFYWFFCAKIKKP